MKACRLLSLAGKSALSPFRALAPFSSSASASPRSSNHDGEEGVSSVYSDALKSKRPPSIRFRKDLRSNSVSFIGSVCVPPKFFTTCYDNLGVRAVLDVKASPESEPTLRVTLKMWANIAEIFRKHFSCNDFIYAAGRLECFTEPVENGQQRRPHYEVTVKELKFVTPRRLGPACQKLEELEPQEGEGEACLDEYRKGIQLWKVFFMNPSKWLDARKTKYDPSHPDFVHKVTGKALWQWPNDPPWIEERLEMLDREIEKQGQDKDRSDKYENDHLWKVFFDNPYEWYDARDTKKSPRQPDFKHKLTGEALWLHPNDPPWIRKQLESLDLRMANQGQGESGLEKYKDDIYLWQIFFTNPDDWWDNRKNKKNPRAPDFKHRDTDEALWQHPDDPPWVKKQLELLDLRRAEQGLRENRGRRSRVSIWEYDQ